MSLSEIVNNRPEYPGPRKEWEMCKQLVDTITQSGALQLLEKLYHSIGSDPSLTYQEKVDDKFKYFLLELRKNLVVRDAHGIMRLAKSESHPAVQFGLDGPHKEMPHTPYASVALFYNAMEYYVRGGFTYKSGLFSPVLEDYQEGYSARTFNTLVVECQNPGTLILSTGSAFFQSWSSRNKYLQGEVVDNATSPEGLRLVDKILGDLYSKSPARAPTVKPIFWGIPPL